MKTRSMFRVLLALVLTLLLTLAACGGDDEGGAPQTTGEGENGGEPIKVGMAVGQSGFMADFDAGFVAGVEMAVEDINSEGGVLGRPLELIYADTKSDKAEGAQAATRLLSEGAEVLLVSTDLDFGTPPALVGQEADKIVFSGAGDPRFGLAIGPNVFNLASLTPGEGASAAEWAHERKGWRSVYIVTDTVFEYTKSVSEFFEQRWTELAGADSIVGEDNILNSDSSFSTQVTRISALPTQPDFIFYSTCPPGGVTFLRQLRAAGVDTPLMGNQCMTSDSWLPSVPNLGEHFNVANYSPYFDDSRPEVNEFFEEHVERAPNVELRLNGLAGYSAIEAFAIAAEGAGSLETDDLRAALESFEDEDLLAGPTTFTPEFHGALGRPWRVLEVRDGAHHYVETLQLVDVPEPRF